MDYKIIKLEVDTELVNSVYTILKKSGEYLYREFKLEHWKTPYSLERIRKDILINDVFIVQDKKTKKFVNTFQIKINPISKKSELSKFATHPDCMGKGIGSLTMEFIEEYSRKKSAEKILLDVYDKSENSIQFYKNKGFQVIGSKKTQRFTVFLMEKII